MAEDTTNTTTNTTNTTTILPKYISAIKEKFNAYKQNRATPTEPSAIEQWVDTSKKKVIDNYDRTYNYVKIKLEDIQDAVLFKDEDFPEYDKIIGLPPLYSSQDIDQFSFNVEEQMVSSFPILSIQPMNYSLVSPNQKLNRAEMQKLNRIFKFAVLADNTISYNHSNTYSPSAITSDLQKLMTFSTAGEVRQLLNVGGGLFGGENARQIMMSVPTLLNQAIKSMDEGFRSYAAKGGTITPALANIGHDVLSNMLMGARTDFPNIWQGSNTNMSWSFTVELRTYASDVTSRMYQEDIILPMNILLSLALPKGGNIMSYIEPPYITANIPNILDVKMGAMTNLNWSIPLSEINMQGIPRHIQVQFSITDLYNVMVQSKTAETNNPEFPNKFRFLKTLESEPSKKAGNKNLWKYEFFRNAPTQSEEQTASRLPINERTQQNIAGTMYNTVTVNYNDANFGDTFVKNYKWQYPEVSFDKLTSSLDWSIPNLVDSMGNPSVSCFKIPNIKNISGLNINNLMAGLKEPLDLTTKSVNLTMNNVVNPFGDSLTNMSSIINENTFTRLQDILNPINMQTLSNNLFSQTPINLCNELSNSCALLTQDIIQSLDGTSYDIKSPLDLLSTTVSNIPSQLTSVVDGSVINPDALLRNVVTNISKTNTKLDSELRLSQTLQEILQRSSNSIVNDVLNKTNVRQDINDLINEGRYRLSSTELLPREIVNAFYNIVDMMSGTIVMSSLQGIMQVSNRTNNGASGLIVRNKS